MAAATATTTGHMQRLPAEALQMVLRYAVATPAGPRRSFSAPPPVAVLRVCRRWTGLALPLFWGHLHLTLEDGSDYGGSSGSRRSGMLRALANTLRVVHRRTTHQRLSADARHGLHYPYAAYIRRISVTFRYSVDRGSSRRSQFPMDARNVMEVLRRARRCRRFHLELYVEGIRIGGGGFGLHPGDGGHDRGLRPFRDQNRRGGGGGRGGGGAGETAAHGEGGEVERQQPSLRAEAPGPSASRPAHPARLLRERLVAVAGRRPPQPGVDAAHPGLGAAGADRRCQRGGAAAAGASPAQADARREWRPGGSAGGPRQQCRCRLDAGGRRHGRSRCSRASPTSA